MPSHAAPELYTVLSGDSADALAQLTPGQTAQLTAALNYHALVRPGAEFQLVFGVGSASQFPAFTDRSCTTGESLAGITPAATLSVQSLASGDAAAHGDVVSVRLSHQDASPATTQPPAPQSFARTTYRWLEQRYPMVLDAARETITRRRERSLAAHPPARQPAPGRRARPEPAEAHAGALSKPAVLFGVHWLQTGGAERWALESIRLAAAAGFTPIVVTDQDSVHPWINRAELDDAVVLTQSFLEQPHSYDDRLLAGIFANFDIVGAVIHHSEWLYRSLPWLRAQHPDVPVVDSLHIVEYLGGGYPGHAAAYTDLIDTHHVISPQLVEWLGDEQHIAADKLALAPLTTLTAGAQGEFQPRPADQPFTIAFVGRLSRQKRPDVFLMLVRALRRRGVAFRAILHGDGELRETVGRLITQLGVHDAIEQRFEDTPVADTLAEADALIVTSMNEGLTLTTFEAVAAGIPVLSTDVGSQRTIVRGAALFPRPAREFVRGSAALIEQLAHDDELRRELWEQQRELVAEFSELPTAHEFMKELFASWQA